MLPLHTLRIWPQDQSDEPKSQRHKSMHKLLKVIYLERQEILRNIKLALPLGPVVQSVVSLTSSLRVISLTVLADSIYNILKFFAEKM